jgi:hypothetical protein
MICQDKLGTNTRKIATIEKGAVFCRTAAAVKIVTAINGAV